jgi:predicted AAA+ superfamily ATPase
MKLSEIKTALEKGEKISSLKINVKTYLPLISKTLMVLGFKEGNETQNGIIDECIDINSGIAYVNHFKKHMTTVCAVINWYTDIEIDNIDLPEDYTNYDYYITSGLWNYVKNQMGNEYKILLGLIDKSIEEELRKYNSIESVVNNNITKLINRVPNDVELKQLARTLVRDVNSMSWDKIPKIKEIFETVQGKKFE